MFLYICGRISQVSVSAMYIKAKCFLSSSSVVINSSAYHLTFPQNCLYRLHLYKHLWTLIELAPPTLSKLFSSTYIYVTYKLVTESRKVPMIIDLLFSTLTVNLFCLNHFPIWAVSDCRLCSNPA